MSENWKKGTICIQGGYTPKAGEPRVLPIFQTATYKYDDPDHLASLFNLEAEGHLYSRISNPTVAALEEKFAKLQGGVGAVATSSGQAAVLYAILNICKVGDHIISAATLYGGTVNLFTVNLKKMGIEVTFVDPEASKEEILALAKENTRDLSFITINHRKEDDTLKIVSRYLGDGINNKTPAIYLRNITKDDIDKACNLCKDISTCIIGIGHGYKKL